MQGGDLTPMSFKVVLLGEGRVGKTSLFLRYMRNLYSDAQQSTVQASYLTKKLNIDGQSCNLSIWDTAGQERFHALGPIYYRDANAAVLVYDITDTESFARIKKWVRELKTQVGSEITICIAGNKIDLEKKRSVSSVSAKSYAASINAIHYETSAKTNRGIEEMFYELTRTLIRKEREKRKRSGAANQGRKSLVIVDNDAPMQRPQKSSKCC